MDFDPSKYLTKLKGKDYLEVKWRLVWLRNQHPDAMIETENVALTDKIAVFQATVKLPSGGVASGHGSETPGDFTDFIEKAETKALGRALAHLGFGTQFCGDELDEGVERNGVRNVVDSPVARRNGPQRMQSIETLSDQQTAARTRGDGNTPATDAKERTKDYRDIQNGHYHAATTERGFTEAAQKLYALAPFPDKTSRRDLTGQELHDLALQVKDDVPLMEDGSPPPTVDYANRMAAAIDRAELARIAAEMRSAGVATDWLRAMWKRRSDEVPSMVMVAETRIAGSAGDDKHTQ